MSSFSSSNAEVPEGNATDCNDYQKPEQNGAQTEDNPVYPEKNATDSNDSQKPEQNRHQVNNNSVFPEKNAADCNGSRKPEHNRAQADYNSVVKKKVAASNYSKKTDADNRYAFRSTFRFVAECIQHILKTYGITWEKPSLGNCHGYFNKKFGKAFMEITEFKRKFYRRNILRLYHTFKDKEEYFVTMFLTFSLIMFSEVHLEFNYSSLTSLFAFAGECAHVFHISGNPDGVNWTVTALRRYIVSFLLKEIRETNHYFGFTRYCTRKAEAQRRDQEPSMIGEHEHRFQYVVNRAEKLLSEIKERGSRIPDFMQVEGDLKEDAKQYIKLGRDNPQSVACEAQIINEPLDDAEEQCKAFLEENPLLAEKHVEGEIVYIHDWTLASTSTTGMTIRPYKTHEQYSLDQNEINTLECNKTNHDVTPGGVTENQQPTVLESNVKGMISDDVGTKFQQLATAEDLTETTSDAAFSEGLELLQLAVTECTVKESSDEDELQHPDIAAKLSWSQEVLSQPQLRQSARVKYVECETGNNTRGVQPAQELNIVIRMENPGCSESADNSFDGVTSNITTSKETKLSDQNAKSPQENKQTKSPGKNKRQQRRKKR